MPAYEKMADGQVDHAAQAMMFCRPERKRRERLLDALIMCELKADI